MARQRRFEPVELINGKLVKIPPFRPMELRDGKLSFIEEPSRSSNGKEPIPVDLRWSVWERDDFTCRHCGARSHLSVDHIHPESKGGTLDLRNLQTLCSTCNSRKGARVLS